MQHPTRNDLIDYDRRELSPQRDAIVHAHLLECASCIHIHENETTLVRILRTRLHAEERELPGAVSLALFDRIAAPAPWWHTFTRPIIAIPATAALAAALVFGSGYLHGSQQPQLDASYFMQDHNALTHTTPFQSDAAVPAELASDTSGDAQP